LAAVAAPVGVAGPALTAAGVVGADAVTAEVAGPSV
jgi:hypothetical protein